MLNRASRLKVLVSVLLASAIFALGCGEKSAQKAPQSTPAIKSAIESGKKTIVFFQNPNGRPCQIQNVELQKLKQTLGDNIKIVYVSAISQADQQAFYDYGIRSLPSIVLLSSKGEIAQYFPPGIHNHDTLMTAVKTAK
jgi:thioredoxin-related protein